MNIPIEDIMNVHVDPAWVSIAAELVNTFPQTASPYERFDLLCAGLRLHLGISDWIICAALHSRLSALGSMDQTMQVSDLHSEGENFNSKALCYAVAKSPLHIRGDYLVFDSLSFRGCLDAAH